MNNLVIGDSLLHRSILAKRKTWIEYSKKIKNIKINSYSSRNSGYLKDLKLKNKYHRVFIQIGVVDSAPRVMKYVKIFRKNRNLGNNFNQIVPNSQRLKAYGIKNEKISLQEYIKFSRRNREKIESINYEKYKNHNPCVSEREFLQNFELFILNNSEFFDRLYLISIIPPHSMMKKNHFQVDYFIEKYNKILKTLSEKYEKVYYLDLVNQTTEWNSLLQTYKINKDRQKVLDDGYHILNEKYDQMANIFDLALENVEQNQQEQYLSI